MNSMSDSPEVRDALQQKSITDLQVYIAEMRTEMKESFKAVHQRQDIANGKILKSESRLDIMDQKRSYDKLIWYLFTTAIATITFLLTYIFF